ncbi:hypothetical protein CDAR_446091 [Caerostris darwini]|uniref:Uncharacterized protein n=1 Tax=Caerostris darwini TaxID=1538125 RepID=A0AAV4SSA9_9ARAC|nr:hypothetical protein CDAR_446091 [Caerostris darwini]
MSRYRSTDRRQHVKEFNRIRCDGKKINQPRISPSLWALRIDKSSLKEQTMVCRMKEKNRTQSECGTPAQNEEFSFLFYFHGLCA